MSKDKKATTEYNIWTLPSNEWHKNLKKIKVSATKVSNLSQKTSKYTGERKASALTFSDYTNPTFGSFKKSVVR